MVTRTESFANKLLYSICFASRTTLCYRDICSLSTLQEMEENPPPDFQLPCFSSWTTSQSVQANIPTSAPLAPRNGHEQPYWYRPHYIGWQYVTSGTFYIAHEVEYFKKKKSLYCTPHTIIIFDNTPRKIWKKKQTNKKTPVISCNHFFFFKFECGKNFLNILFIKSLPNSFYWVFFSSFPVFAFLFLFLFWITVRLK